MVYDLRTWIRSKTNLIRMKTAHGGASFRYLKVRSHQQMPFRRYEIQHMISILTITMQQPTPPMSIIVRLPYYTPCICTGASASFHAPTSAAPNIRAISPLTSTSSPGPAAMCKLCSYVISYRITRSTPRRSTPRKELEDKTHMLRMQHKQSLLMHPIKWLSRRK